MAALIWTEPALSDLDAIAIKWQGASYARHNQNGTMTATMTSDHIRLHEQLSASGNEHLVCEISSLKLNGPLEDHEGQWQVAKKSRASARILDCAAAGPSQTDPAFGVSSAMFCNSQEGGCRP